MIKEQSIVSMEGLQRSGTHSRADHIKMTILDHIAGDLFSTTVWRLERGQLDQAERCRGATILRLQNTVIPTHKINYYRERISAIIEFFIASDDLCSLQLQDIPMDFPVAYREPRLGR